MHRNEFLETVKKDALDFDTPIPYFIGVMICFVLSLVFNLVLDMPLIGFGFIIVEFILLYVQLKKSDPENL